MKTFVRRFILIALFSSTLAGCVEEVLHVEDTPDCYVILKKGRVGLFSFGSTHGRPDLKDLQKVNGDLPWICSQIHGLNNPRIIVETKNKGFYCIVYQWNNRKALDVLAKFLNLEVVKENREIPAITIRISAGGHALKRAKKGIILDFDNIAVDENGWLLDGASADELAAFLETRFRVPVVNMTNLEGRWCIRLSERAAKNAPHLGEKSKLDDLGLEIQREKLKVYVTAIKDRGQNPTRSQEK